MILHSMLTFLLLSVHTPSVFARESNIIQLDLRPEQEEKNPDPVEELAQIHKRILKGELPEIQFDLGSWKIRGESYPTLDLIADILLRNPRYKLLVFAHTCDIGTAQFNLEISLKRAKAVKGYLVRRGVPPPSIRFRGKGLSEPIADNSTQEGRTKNRRVEFKLLKRSWSSVY